MSSKEEKDNLAIAMSKIDQAAAHLRDDVLTYARDNNLTPSEAESVFSELFGELIRVPIMRAAIEKRYEQ